MPPFRNSHSSRRSLQLSLPPSLAAQSSLLPAAVLCSPSSSALPMLETNAGGGDTTTNGAATATSDVAQRNLPEALRARGGKFGRSRAAVSKCKKVFLVLGP
eukprot:CAMPEP_0204101040 /NCGR_PEP_ID=MMETSP0360-20130528/194271_1 /ASSEMBLY_ACC=CAM_ASM_000342 /TAXON_ID=268821 /ORGANISM="Scrippsiella Hangoei, Strain SHTV-5" /LENGTH=101 /DNA_ID=CAMNT_0051050439 /DNA_START=716 /DNA_END=1017 /DNA_ORIENTATION=-